MEELGEVQKQKLDSCQAQENGEGHVSNVSIMRNNVMLTSKCGAVAPAPPATITQWTEDGVVTYSWWLCHAPDVASCSQCIISHNMPV